MKRRTGFALFAATLLMVAVGVYAQSPKGPGYSDAPPSVPENWYAKSYALVVGINSYTSGWPRLSSAVGDADKVASALSSQGFTVYRLADAQATRTEIMRHLLNVIPPLLSEHDRFVFYFSGHGQTQDAPGGQTGYLVPFDGQRSSGQDQWYTYISMKELKDALVNQVSAKHVMVVVDSCFSGLLTTKSVGVSGAWKKALSYKGRMILTAGAQNEQALDGGFAPVFVDAVKGQADTNGDGYITFGELSLYVQQNISARSNQRPVYGWWEGNGEMVFANTETANGEIFSTSSTSNRIQPASQQPFQQPAAANDTRVVRTSGRFQITSCGSIIDPKTNLEWYPWDGVNRSWEDSLKRIRESDVCGYSDWRLPKINELKTLYDPTYGIRAIDPNFIPNKNPKHNVLPCDAASYADYNDHPTVWCYRFCEEEELVGYYLPNFSGNVLQVRERN